jgi:hypothetical protein
MFQGGSDFQNDLYSNIPTMAMMMTMYTTTFGNGSFVVQPASKGTVQAGFPTVPYFPLEAIFYNQQASNPSVAPTNIQGGTTSNEQSIQGQQTIVDNNGNTIGAMGYFPEGIIAS